MLSVEKLQARQRGYSIVELMVAILIGLIVLAGVLQVVISSKQAFLGQEDMSYIQENARYAVDVMTKDIQSSGFWGCAGQSPKTAMVAQVASNANAQAILGREAIEAVENFPEEVTGSIDLWEPQVDTADYLPDSFIVRMGGGETHSIVRNDGALLLDQAPSFDAQSYLVVVAEDCRRIGVIKSSAKAERTLSYDANSICASGSGLAIKPKISGAPFSCDTVEVENPPVEPYLPGSTIMQYFAYGYFIGESSVLANQPALKRIVLNGTANSYRVEEIALGVEDLQIKYGVRSGANIRYFESEDMIAAVGAGTAAWSDVVSVQLGLVFRSQTPSASEIDGRPKLGNVYNDRYIRQEITSTIQLRNRT